MYTAGPSGWLRYLASQTPLSRSIGSLTELLGDGSVWILVTSGIIEQQLNQSSNQLGSQAFCPVVMHSPVTGLFRVLLDRFLLPTIRPPFQEQRTTGHTQSALLQCCNVWSDGLTAKTLGKYCSCTSASVGRASSPAHHSTI